MTPLRLLLLSLLAFPLCAFAQGDPFAVKPGASFGRTAGAPQNVAASLPGKVKMGGGGVWGPVPMPPNAAVPDPDIKKLVDWILKLG